MHCSPNPPIESGAASTVVLFANVPWSVRSCLVQRFISFIGLLQNALACNRTCKNLTVGLQKLNHMQKGFESLVCSMRPPFFTTLLDILDSSALITTYFGQLCVCSYKTHTHTHTHTNKNTATTISCVSCVGSSIPNKSPYKILKSSNVVDPSYSSFTEIPGIVWQKGCPPIALEDGCSAGRALVIVGRATLKCTERTKQISKAV